MKMNEMNVYVRMYVHTYVRINNNNTIIQYSSIGNGGAI